MLKIKEHKRCDRWTFKVKCLQGYESSIPRVEAEYFQQQLFLSPIRYSSNILLSKIPEESFHLDPTCNLETM